MSVTRTHFFTDEDVADILTRAQTIVRELVIDDRLYVSAFELAVQRLSECNVQIMAPSLGADLSRLGPKH